MNYEKFDELYNDSFDIQDLHMGYIMENCAGDRIIGNGDSLIIALEDGYLYEDFRDDYIAKNMVQCD
jgi:hypothetical protein